MAKKRTAKRKSKPENNTWIVETQAKVAEFFKVRLKTVQGWRLRGMPGEPSKYDLKAITKWISTNHRDYRFLRTLDTQPVEADPLLVGSQSPALERYRDIKSQREELRLKEEFGELCRTTDVRDTISILINNLKKARERLKPEAAEVIDETIESIQLEIKGKFP